MRTSLSCDACRKSKLKCVHSGSPPCTRCERSDIPDCQLKRPRTKGRQTRTSIYSTRRVPNPGDVAEPGGRTPSQAQSSVDNPRNDHDGPATVRPSASTDSHLETLPISTIINLFNIFVERFPEMQMLHPVTFQRLFQPDQKRSPGAKGLLSTMMAALKKQQCDLNLASAGNLLPHHTYASYACDTLAKCMLEAPDIVVVQAHLILAIYEWGVRDFQKAWIHCGVAIRIMQSLHSVRVAPDELPGGTECDDICQIVETSTFWTCFVLDCFISSGTYNPRMLSMSEMRKLGIPRPAPLTGFMFGFKQQILNQEPSILDLEHVSEILTIGFDIYADVMAWVHRDGRRAPGMCASEQCPWNPASYWGSCWSRLLAWRQRIDPRLLYPSIDVGLFAERKELGRLFIYTNLLYFHCVLMLHREYFPFLPKPNAFPQGPTDPPLLEADPPPGWWVESSRHLFQAATNVADLIQQASLWGFAIMTPVPAFCCFTACYMNQYALFFPRMTMGHGSRAEEMLEAGLVYLREFRKAWELGDGWLKTIQNARLLFEHATTKADSYANKSRSDFEALHRSAHEFRTLDRSEQHLATIRNAESIASTPNRPRTDHDTTSEILLDFPGFDMADLSIDRMLWPTWDSFGLEFDQAVAGHVANHAPSEM